jgi:hypothetical protein
LYGKSEQRKEKRTAGEGAVKPGQVPREKDGRYTEADIKELNRLVQVAALEAQRKGIAVPPVESLPVLQQSDMNRIIWAFSLGGDDFVARSQRLNPSELFTLNGRLVPGNSRASRYSSADRTGIQSESSQCQTIAQQQSMRRIQLRPSNLLTAFPKRWLDSVFIDSVLHIWKRYFKFPDLLYINSAENDPTLNELKMTAPCYKYLLVPLFLRSHWTIIFIDHVTRRVRYLNSQVVDDTPNVQMEPFKRTFVGYDTNNVTLSRQTDNSSCGVFALFFAFMYLFFDERDMDNISQASIDEFRHLLVLQVLLHFFILRRN